MDVDLLGLGDVQEVVDDLGHSAWARLHPDVPEAGTVLDLAAVSPNPLAGIVLEGGADAERNDCAMAADGIAADASAERV